MQQIGKYQLIRKLAAGGMAEVFLAKAAGPMGFEKTLVLKRILPHLAGEPAFVEMFLSEAKLAARLTHPNIVQIFDFGEADGAYFLAMEYIDGPSLRVLIKRAQAQGMLLPPTVCARLIALACEGLAFAHDFTDPETGEALGLVHRDVSPDNILLSRQGAVKVVDFGIAKAAGESPTTQRGVIKGKLAYMPPEQIRAETLDRRVDVYALGVVLYELLTARKPFVSSSDAALMSAILFEAPFPASQARLDLPTGLQRILDRALTKDREQRYPDCHSLQSDLEEFILQAGKPVVTQQIAQLINQSTTGTNLPVASPQTAMPLNVPGRAVTPVHTPVPTDTKTEVDVPNVPTGPATVQIRPRITTPPPVVDAPRARSGAATLPDRPSRPREPLPSEEMVTRQQRALVKSWRSRGGVLALMGGGALLAAGGGVVLLRPGAEPALPEPTRVAEIAPPPPSPSAPSIEDAGVGDPATPSAPAPERKPAPEQNPAPKQAPQETVTPKSARSKPTRVALGSLDPALNGTLVLRISPDATVAVDGHELGDTPMAPVEILAGRHSVTLISPELSKIVTRRIVVKPGQATILKVNLQEE